MAKFSYLWKTTDKGKEMWLPLQTGRRFQKKGWVTFEGKYKLGWAKGKGTVLKKVK